MRAYVFRCSPNNGLCQDTSACPFGATPGNRVVINSRQLAGIVFSTIRTQYDAPWPRIESLNL